VTLPPSRTLYELLGDQATAHPDHPAVVTADGARTYRELHVAAGRVAAGLHRLGVGPGDSVALLMDNRREWLDVAFGCAAIGARLAPFNTWAKAWDLAYLLAHAAPKVLVTVDRWARQDFVQQLAEILPELGQGALPSARVPTLRHVVVLGDAVPEHAVDYRSWAGPAGALPPPGGAAPDDVAMVLYTSGSTARPKAVGLTHRHLIENGFAIGERQGLQTGDRIFLASPLFWALGGANALMAALTHASTLVLQSPFAPAGALDILETQRCTAAYLLPVMVHALLREPSFAPGRLAALRRGVTLGTPSEIRLTVEALGVSDICNIYGSTETYGNCCVTPADAPLARRATSQGPPLPGVEIRIVDAEAGHDLGAGEVGEILVKGHITPGYLDDTGHPQPVVDDDGFFHTGDVGSLDGDGWLTFASRSSEMIKTSGINVSPSEVEDFLLSHPDVGQAVVAGGHDPERGQLVVAFVHFRPSSVTTPDELRAWCRDRIAGFKVPAVIVALEAFPTTDTGKVARKRLAAMADEVVAGRSGVTGSGR
jgi:fatty-acyl-CoA synthase